jgi:hypothetical protein
MSIVNKINAMRHIGTSEIDHRIQFAVGDKLLHEFMLVLVPLQIQIKEDLKNV